MMKSVVTSGLSDSRSNAADKLYAPAWLRSATFSFLLTVGIASSSFLGGNAIALGFGFGFGVSLLLTILILALEIVLLIWAVEWIHRIYTFDDPGKTTHRDMPHGHPA